jgi:hypothetical protein
MKLKYSDLFDEEELKAQREIEELLEHGKVHVENRKLTVHYDPQEQEAETKRIVEEVVKTVMDVTMRNASTIACRMLWEKYNINCTCCPTLSSHVVDLEEVLK